MANRYIDLTLSGYGHAGTQGDPYGLDEAFQNGPNEWNSYTSSIVVPDSADSFYIKGSILFPDSTNIGLGTGNVAIGIGSTMATLLPWDATVNGPWRIGIGGTSTNMQLGTATLISGGIFNGGNVQLGIGFATSIYGPISVTTCAFDAGAGGVISLNANTDTNPHSYKGCSFRGYDILYGNLMGVVRADTTDCLLNAGGSISSNSFAQTGFKNCAMTMGIGASYPATVVKVNDQTNWVVGSYPAWDASRSAWKTSLVSAGINTPPEPGTPPYTDYTTGLWGETRTGIGALYFKSAMSYFDTTMVTTDNFATSNVGLDTLVQAIQDNNPDTYFDSTSEVGRVVVYYTHQDGRQVKRIVHQGTGMTGTVAWFATARDGTWQKTRVKTFDPDGASHDLFRASIGTEEDITLTDGTVTLNLA